jgi:hypothetical protein
MKIFLIPLIGICLLICGVARAQDKESVVDKIINFPTTFFSKVNSKYSNLEDKLTKQTEIYLQRLKNKEKKMKRKLAKTDSAEAEQTFGDIDGQYDKMIAAINQDSLPVKRSSGAYMPMVDSIKTSLAFLNQNGGVLSESKEVQDKVKGSLSQVNQMQGKLQQADQIKAFIQQRKQQIKGSLGNISNMPKGLANEFAGFQKEAYYYSAQLKEYKDILNDPDKMVQKGLSLLNKLPAFTNFMKQNSQLASLFRLPDNYGTPASLAGLQTRSMVQQQIQNQLAGGGPSAQQYLQQNLQAAQSQLNSLKDKLNNLGGGGSNGGSDMDMPDFKPNNQRTKTFWQRLEYGTNIQTAKNYFFPTTTDLGLSAGYKLNDKSTVGLGASYKMGWGQDIKHIHITNQGMGLRSYIDKKLKGSFYLSGGLEYNYQPITSDSLNTNTAMHWNEISSWSKCRLIGVSKIVSVKGKFFKKTKLQLLFDFLSYQQVPRTQPIKFRVGYNF